MAPHKDSPADISYDRPPLVETVIGVQFDPIAPLNAAHLGWYWRDYLAEAGWTPPAIVDPIPDQREYFVRDGALPSFPIHVEIGPPAGRMQSRSQDNVTLLQVQRTRFVLNWIRAASEAAYPRWATLLPAFNARFRDFATFIGRAGFPALSVNQWEVVYVNHIPRATLWNETADFSEVVPALFPKEEGIRLPRGSSQASYQIVPQRGRLHIEASRKASIENPQQQILHLQLTARGEVRGEAGWSYEEGLALGHDAIVDAFTKIASDRAQQFWGRR